MAPNPDQEMLTLLGRRDPRGFDRAYAKYGARLFSFLTRLVGRAERHLAEDLLQQTFLRLAEHGPELRADSDLRAWLFTVARNAFLGQLRKRRLATDSSNLELVPDYSPDAEAQLMLGDLEQALARLRVEDRELLLLVGAEGLEPLAVAKMLGIEPPALLQAFAARSSSSAARPRALSTAHRQGGIVMSEPELLLQRLRELPLEAPPGALSKQLTAAAHARLVPRKVHPAWSVGVAASVLVYLGWALAYTSQLY